MGKNDMILIGIAAAVLGLVVYKTQNAQAANAPNGVMANAPAVLGTLLPPTGNPYSGDAYTPSGMFGGTLFNAPQYVRSVFGPANDTASGISPAPGLFNAPLFI
ncbi:hypothetical protein [Ralstonia sp. NFACC01]|uniref:hypothetical protein n=1 Tax=Ralstonia sp. NFACC01 TaxID=1566294 RepID=UPI0008F4484E|nr:hypothetical protein [Ralstonia sp. NFACC01]SFQ19326.1 hypothetical protein SAMN03159417_04558 [Ralstonia sp. NFACC01]